MQPPEMAVLAEGDLPTGERWTLKARVSGDDLYTVLETLHPDGHSDAGGMGGPALDRGKLMNVYTGGSDRGRRRVLARTDPRVARLRLEVAGGEELELSPVATRSDLGLAFFVALLPGAVGLTTITAIGADGRALQSRDLATHEAHWRRFRGRSEHPES